MAARSICETQGQIPHVFNTVVVVVRIVVIPKFEVALPGSFLFI